MVLKVFYMAMIMCLNTQEKQGKDTIYPFVGVGNFRLNKTTLFKVKKSNPNAEISKYWEDEGCLFSVSSVKKVVLDDKGLVLFYRRKRLFRRYFLDEIRMCQEFKGKTIGGVGIGSSYYDIIKEFGESKIFGYHVDDSWYYGVAYEDYKSEGWVIHFYCYKYNADKSDFIVERIEMNAR
jgi:hypothetical protein